MNKTVAIVLTYNRLALLKECISSLRGQSAPVDQILVVNNASTDGTLEWLSEQQDLLVFTMPFNMGGSGGFVKAITEAYALNFDWIWILDDDAFPDRNCLRNLKAVAETTDSRQIVLAPLVIEGDRIDHEHRGFIDFKKIKFPLQMTTSDQIIHAAEPVMGISFASFIGMFISRDIVTEVKFPNPSYFIFQDDLEYCIRITKAGYPIYLVKSAVVHHKHKGTVPVERFFDGTAMMAPVMKPRKTVFQFLQDKRVKYTDASRINPMLFISKRNWIWTIMQHNGMSLRLAAYLIKDISRSMSYVVLSRANNGLLFKLFRATYFQGLTGKLDNQQFLSRR